jgi:hypothetical protein
MEAGVLSKLGKENPDDVTKELIEFGRNINLR